MKPKPRKKIVDIRKHLCKMANDPLFRYELAMCCIDHLTIKQCKEVFKDLQDGDWEFMIDGLCKYTL
jgi:hypothetical protein